MKTQPIPAGKRVEDMVKEPTVAIVDYRDGTRACMFTLNGAAAEWTTAWKDDAGKVTSLRWVLQEDRPYSHFAVLNAGIEQMMHSGRPTWPVERTLLTSGLVDETLQSLHEGKRRETPHLDVKYKSDWNWTMPIDPARPRPHGAQ